MKKFNSNQFISRVILELKPKSRQLFDRLLFRRENSKLKFDKFIQKKLEEDFFNQYQNQTIAQGIYIQLDQWILFVVDVEYNQRKTEESQTIIEFLHQGSFVSEHFFENQLNKNQNLNSTTEDQKILDSTRLIIEHEESSSKISCSQCEKDLSDADFVLITKKFNQTIFCFLCSKSKYFYECHRCQQSILFQNEISSNQTNDLQIDFVEHNGFYWHSTCSRCLICSKLLIGKQFYQDPIYNHLFCDQHVPD